MGAIDIAIGAAIGVAAVIATAVIAYRAGKTHGIEEGVEGLPQSTAYIAKSERGLYRTSLERDGKAIFVSPTGRASVADAIADVEHVNAHRWVARDRSL